MSENPKKVIEFNAGIEAGLRLKSKIQTERIIQTAIGWINSNFPAPEVSDAELRNLRFWTVRKSSLLKDLIVRLHLILSALRRMELEIETISQQHRRATFQEAFSDEIQKNRANFERSLFVPPGPNFLKNVQRITSLDYSVIGERQQDDQVEDALTIFQIYVHVFQKMSSVAPSFLLALSHAEVQFVALTTDAETQILLQETADSKAKIKSAREREKILAHNRDEAVRVFLDMPEEDRQKFFEHRQMAAFYKAFRDRANALNVQWVTDKTGKKTTAPPSRNTIEKYIAENQKVALDTPPTSR